MIGIKNNEFLPGPVIHFGRGIVDKAVAMVNEAKVVACLSVLRQEYPIICRNLQLKEFAKQKDSQEW